MGDVIYARFGRRPGEWGIPRSSGWTGPVQAIDPLGVLAAVAGIAWAWWAGTARLGLLAGLAVLDAAEGRGR